MTILNTYCTGKYTLIKENNYELNEWFLIYTTVELSTNCLMHHHVLLIAIIFPISKQNLKISNMRIIIVRSFIKILDRKICKLTT